MSGRQRIDLCHYLIFLSELRAPDLCKQNPILFLFKFFQHIRRLFVTIRSCALITNGEKKYDYTSLSPSDGRNF